VPTPIPPTLVWKGNLVGVNTWVHTIILLRKWFS
jgi:hypothetical protein